MNYAFNRIKFNRQVVSCIAKEGMKKYSKNNCKNNNKIVARSYSQHYGPEKDPFPSWKIIAFLSGLALYHQYKNNIYR